MATRAVGMSHASPRIIGGFGVTDLLSSDWLNQAAALVAPIQDLDPESATFGMFTFLAGVSGWGDAPV